MTNESSTLLADLQRRDFQSRRRAAVLEQAGHRYTTRSDTETILHAYEQHGPDCLSAHFGACSAFAIWDNQRPSAFARDRLGDQAALLLLGQ